jgi:TonB family protein
MSKLFFSPTKSAVSFVLFFFLGLNAEASCFLRHQLYRMQSSTLEDIQTFLTGEGWEREGLHSPAENRSGFEFRKTLFTKGYGEKIAVYSALGYGNIIHLELSADCFQTLSVQEFGQVNRKLLVEQEKVIQEYRDANQIVQLIEYAGNEETNPEILIFSEALKSQVQDIDQLFSATTASNRVGAGMSSPATGSSDSTNEIYEVVETQPNPPGGMAGWNKYLAENLRYPTTAMRMELEGTVIVAFVVNTDGSTTDIEILRSVGGGCDEEVIRIVKGSPKWSPGMQRGEAVRTRMRLPVKFKLSEPDTSKNGLLARPPVPDLNGSPEAKTEVLYDLVDIPPSPIGGTAAWNLHLSENLTYPMSARSRRIQGTVWVTFVVDTDGSIQEVALVEGIGGGCDEEAMRVIKGSARWSPGMINGRAVRTRMSLPIRFKLG